ncbi:hypothetical protein KY290_031417 [Solanum tuberosum]|uniref:Uncharacterized protein n=1 Tax=Solanum tuberosum TaxID=4113 RepID=A0ABQ7U940_SOLTU|nr:hypothetical protein KY289_030807 [Solanum tuberosum]KAH0743424.1 hypothetical protein KY290_031417 [Solanum tuberosum]
MSTSVKLDLDKDGVEVNQTMYRGIIGSLFYLTTSRLAIVFCVGMCARFQATPKEFHLKASKRILRYLKGTQDLVLFYLIAEGKIKSYRQGCKLKRGPGPPKFINKVLVPRIEKRTVASAADLFLMEKLDELEEINLPAIMLEYECVKGKSRGRSQKAVLRERGTSDGNEQVLQKLKDENERLLKTNASPSEEVKALNMQLIKAHEDANEHLSMLMRTLNPFPLPS